MRDTSTEALLFDLGGVVFGIDFDHAFSHWAICAGVSVEDIKSRCHIGEAYEQHERGEIRGTEFFDALRDTLGVSISDEDLVTGWNAIFEDEFAGAFDLFSSLASRIPIYAFSNTNVIHQEFWERKYAKTLEFFSEVFVSCDLGMRKPEPEAFRHVATCMGREPESILFFDDTRENVEGARDIGMPAVQVFGFADVRMHSKAFVE